MARRSGRRRGKPDTREAILAAARARFAAHGYDAASVRGIAADAEVDPALVYHYFGSKEDLFTSTVAFPLDPAEMLSRELPGDPGSAGERLARTFLANWDSPLGTAGIAILRSAVNSELAARLLREFLTRRILRPAMAMLDIDPAEAPLRASLVASQLAGLALVRYVLKVEPIASLPSETVVAAVAPTVQRYLTGDLGTATAH